MKFGPITTGIIEDGLVFNTDAANRTSYPKTGNYWYDTIEGGKGYPWTNANMTFYAEPFYTSSYQGSIYFDGVDDYADGDYSSTLTAPFSMESWFRFVQAPRTSQFEYVMQFGSDWSPSPSANQQISISRIQEGGYLDFPAGSMYCYTGAASISSSIDLSGTTWNQVVLVATDSAPYLKAYHNGVEAIMQTPGGPISTQDGNITFGKNRATYWEANVEMASGRLYNRALSSTEVLHNYNALKSRFT